MYIDMLFLAISVLVSTPSSLLPNIFLLMLFAQADSSHSFLLFSCLRSLSFRSDTLLVIDFSSLA